MDRLMATFAIPMPVNPSTTVYSTARGMIHNVNIRIAHSVTWT